MCFFQEQLVYRVYTHQEVKCNILFQKPQFLEEHIKERWSMYEHFASGGWARAAIWGRFLQSTCFTQHRFWEIWTFHDFLSFLRNMCFPRNAQKCSWGVWDHFRTILDHLGSIMEQKLIWKTILWKFYTKSPIVVLPIWGMLGSWFVGFLHRAQPL